MKGDDSVRTFELRLLYRTCVAAVRSAFGMISAAKVTQGNFYETPLAYSNLSRAPVPSVACGSVRTPIASRSQLFSRPRFAFPCRASSPPSLSLAQLTFPNRSPSVSSVAGSISSPSPLPLPPSPSSPAPSRPVIVFSVNARVLSNPLPVSRPPTPSKPPSPSLSVPPSLSSRSVSHSLPSSPPAFQPLDSQMPPALPPSGLSTRSFSALAPSSRLSLPAFPLSSTSSWSSPAACSIIVSLCLATPPPSAASHSARSPSLLSYSIPCPCASAASAALSLSHTSSKAFLNALGKSGV